MKLLVINGPNLNLLGSRQPEVYGTLTLEQIEAHLAKRAGELGVELKPFQANEEGAIIDFLQREAEAADGVIINPGALTHYSLSLRDALQATRLPIVEVHISNIYSREEFRRHSVVADIALGQISGLGWRGYIAALETLVEILRERGG
jgi:3-dehydroquinate dehydratase-2